MFVTKRGDLGEAVVERELLKITRDPAERRQIQKLLLDEEAKLKKYEEDHKKE